MILREFYDYEPKGWQEVGQDHSTPKWGDARKTKLTLGQISKIRKMNEVMAFERAQDLKKIRQQYAPAASDSSGL